MKATLKGLVFALLLGLAPLTLAQEMAPINVNQADAEMLAELPGIGPSKAQAIIEDRETNGPFSAPDDLTRVSGIGPATVEAMRDQLEF
ncbi:ComEA family DNA-binding protein [Halomonas pacifica]|uniref:ComEA family DNA-binding protein n=1 Tax=Bisbaumannia pacifica TaxID=77098 RepID=UPI0023587BF2|nr:ComEA family DNA-binding protein [Halomonas pacifica]MDC8803860.1 ComEA family DNA-binding protein [Halomonas pacifica]